MDHTHVPIRVYANVFDLERLILTFFHTGTYVRDGLQRIFYYTRVVRAQKGLTI